MNSDPHGFRKLAQERWDEILSQREEILSAFIAKYGGDPDEMIQYVEYLPNGDIKWWVSKKPKLDSPLPYGEE